MAAVAPGHYHHILVCRRPPLPSFPSNQPHAFTHSSSRFSLLHRDLLHGCRRAWPPPPHPRLPATATPSISFKPATTHSRLHLHVFLFFIVTSSMAVAAPGHHHSLVCWRPPPSQSLHFLRPNPDLVSSSSPQIWVWGFSGG